MATKGVKQNGSKYAHPAQSASIPNDFPPELTGEFNELPSQLWTNFGVVCGRALAHGGYVGVSITDDGGSAKLAVRCPYVTFEKRIYKLADLERLIAYLLTKTQD